MKRVVITANDSGKTLQKFLQKKYSKLPSSLMYKEIRKKNIKVNHKHTDPKALLHTNDVLELYLNDDVLEERPKYYDFMAASNAIDIIYENSNFMIVDKDPGVLCHPANGDYSDNVIARVQKYLYNKGEWDPEENEFTPALVNRIDRNTSGLVIAAKNSDSLKLLNSKMKSHEIEKYYLALVIGVPNETSKTIKSYLIKDNAKNIVKISNEPTPNSKEIISEYKMVYTDGKSSLLEINLKTGRTHQIRAQLASIGLPIVGDGKYGNNKTRSRQKLCSYKIVFNFNSDEILPKTDKHEFVSNKCDFANYRGI